MKTRSKSLLVVLCAAILVIGAVFGTMAYLTSTDSVTNTFTVGNVAITLDEAEVDNAGNSVGAERVKENSYKLMPGHKYTKDPVVHFAADSEASYLFVKVENGISDIEDTVTVADQMIDKGWLPLEGSADIYYKDVEASGDTDVDYPVFDSFKVKGDVSNDKLAEYKDKKIVVTAYAVQKDGFESAAAAWNATFGKSDNA